MQRARGYRSIIVNGVETFTEGKCTDAMPGTLLRHGRMEAQACKRSSWTTTAIPTARSILSGLRSEFYMLHVFKKKAKSGIATPKSDLALIERRLKLAQEMTKNRRT